MKLLPALLLAVVACPIAVAGGQAPQQTISIVVDQSCRILPDSDPAVMGDHYDSFRDPAVCHLESVFSSQHVEVRVADGERSRSAVRIREHEFVLQNVTELPAVFTVRQLVPEGWTVNSDPQPVGMDGNTAIFRVYAIPGMIVRLHVGMQNTVPIADDAR